MYNDGVFVPLADAKEIDATFRFISFKKHNDMAVRSYLSLEVLDENVLAEIKDIQGRLDLDVPRGFKTDALLRGRFFIFKADDVKGWVGKSSERIDLSELRRNSTLRMKFRIIGLKSFEKAKMCIRAVTIIDWSLINPFADERSKEEGKEGKEEEEKVEVEGVTAN